MQPASMTGLDAGRCVFRVAVARRELITVVDADITSDRVISQDTRKGKGKTVRALGIA